MLTFSTQFFCCTRLLLCTRGSSITQNLHKLPCDLFSPPNTLSARIRILSPYYHQLPFKNMKSPHNRNQPTSSKSQTSANPIVDKFQKIIHSDTTDAWDKCWEEGLTPWDLGRATPILVHLHNAGLLPKGRALVPGCGSGYDVVAIACPERHVIGLDIAENAINKAIELSSASPNVKHFTFVSAEFFNWHPAELFDLIFDYTFFCAIEPELRSHWARKMSDLLKPDGELITLMFPIDDHEGGPPYKVSVNDYEEALHPVGLKATHISDNELVIPPRKGKEKLGRWKKIVSQSSL